MHSLNIQFLTSVGARGCFGVLVARRESGDAIDSIIAMRAINITAILAKNLQSVCVRSKKLSLER